MAADVKTKYGAAGQAITCTLAALANAGARESTVVDNSANLYLDALVQLQVKSNAAGTVATGYVDVYAYGTVDGGTTYSDSATGADAGITLTSPPNARMIGRINVVANAVTYQGHPMSVAAAFGGVLPDHWGIIVMNGTGAALDAVEAAHLKLYQGVYAQTT